MAINNGRTIIGGYQGDDGNTYVEYSDGTTSVTPTINNVNNNTFTPEEVYRMQSDGYSNQGNQTLSNAFGGIADSLGTYSKFANNSLGAYQGLLDYIRGNEQGLQGASRNLWNELTRGIEADKQYAMDTFGPNGSLTKEINTYYDDLGNYLQTDAGRQAATIAAQGQHSGASLGAIRAQQNEAYNESFGRYVKAKEQQINAKQQLASNLLNYMSALRKEYGDTTNQYVIEMYKRANDMYNAIAQSAATDLMQYNNLLATPRSSGGSSSSSSNGNLLNDILVRALLGNTGLSGLLTPGGNEEEGSEGNYSEVSEGA